MSNILHIFEMQKWLLENKPMRGELLDYIPQSKKLYKAKVYRNHSFELVEHTIKAYLDFSDMQIDFEYSDYDDSLSFLDVKSDFDFLILWIDVSRYKENMFYSFFKERLVYLKSIYKNPILVVLCCNNERMDLGTDVLQVDLSNIQSELGDDFFDERLEHYSGTKMSSKACLEVAKLLGLQYIPAIIKPVLKAIVVDLDNTLYKGILGEDGVAGIELTSGHVELQKTLVRLSKQGFLLGIVSKNELRDVQQLFEERTDFLLKWDDFSYICASWDEKATSIDYICKKLNIGIDSVLFIDDNMGELVHVKDRHPSIHEILASLDGDVTNKVLKTYPGLLKVAVKYEDSIRKGDLQANEERKKMQNKYSMNEYLKALNVKITFTINDIKQLERISELANKTNQFIFNYKRYTIAELQSKIESDNYVICAVSLEDKLSDSGIIGVCVVKKEGEVGCLDECFVSCRALGRGLDELIVLGAIKYCTETLGVKKFKTSFIKGERNNPAAVFYEKHLSLFDASEEIFEYEPPKDMAKIILKNNYLNKMKGKNVL